MGSDLEAKVQRSEMAKGSDLEAQVQRSEMAKGSELEKCANMEGRVLRDNCEMILERWSFSQTRLFWRSGEDLQSPVEVLRPIIGPSTLKQLWRRKDHLIMHANDFTTSSHNIGPETERFHLLPNIRPYIQIAVLKPSSLSTV